MIIATIGLMSIGLSVIKLMNANYKEGGLMLAAGLILVVTEVYKGTR